MLLYVANTSRQRHDFYYTLPGSRSWQHQYIEMGKQIRVAGELDPVTIDMIVGHHARHGMIRDDEVSRAEEKVPLVYAIGGPIAASVIERVIHHNDKVLTEQGRRMREEAGMAAAAKTDWMLQERRPPGEAMRNTQITITEDKRDPRDTSPEVSVGLQVTETAELASKHIQKRRSSR